MYAILWEYQVRPEHESDFTPVYSERGEWAQLFRKNSGYIGTELFRDQTKKGRYVTIDRWRSKEAYDEFRSNWLEDYEALDQKCGDWTETESALGCFENASATTDAA